jgi:hypothetical protein
MTDVKGGKSADSISSLIKYVTEERSAKAIDESDKVISYFPGQYDSDTDRFSPIVAPLPVALKDFIKNAYLAIYLVKGKANDDAAQKIIKTYLNNMDRLGKTLNFNWKNYPIFNDVLGKVYSSWSGSMTGEMAANIFNVFSKAVIDKISAAINSPHGKTLPNIAEWNKLLNADFLSSPQQVGAAFGSKTGINQGTIMLANSVVTGLGKIKDPERASVLALQRCEGSVNLDKTLVETGKWPTGVEPYHEIKTPEQVNTTVSSPSPPPVGSTGEGDANKVSDAWLNEGVICMASAILYILRRTYYISQIKEH